MTPRRPRVAYQGEPGAYSQIAVAQLFEDADESPMHSVNKVFDSVQVGSSDFGVVPIENSHAGSINETYDRLVSHEVQILAETTVRVTHCLLGTSSTLSSVQRVYSHPQALEQCDEFLDSIGAERVAVHDTAGAARMVGERKDPAEAAIASARSAEMYGLEVLAADIEDRPDNSTKFIVIGKEQSKDFGLPTKTAIVFAAADVPGSLHRCLQEFASADINLSKLESRPSGGKAWRYHFYLDFDCPAGDPKAVEALAGLADHTSFLRVLGSFPSS